MNLLTTKWKSSHENGRDNETIPSHLLRIFACVKCENLSEEWGWVFRSQMADWPGLKCTVRQVKTGKVHSNFGGFFMNFMSCPNVRICVQSIWHWLCGYIPELTATICLQHRPPNYSIPFHTYIRVYIYAICIIDAAVGEHRGKVSSGKPTDWVNPE